MQSKFGILTKLTFLQDIASNCVAAVNPAIIHNIEKYIILSKCFYYTAIEDIRGDYLEFGVYTGSSFCHAIRSYNKCRAYEKYISTTRFFGFDSFAGFGQLKDIDKHPFYENENFATDYDKVQKRIKKFTKNLDIRLIKGFYNESLKNGANSLGIEKARIIFIDCDTYHAAEDALIFCSTILQAGTIIILDDNLSYKGNINAGITRAFSEYLNSTHMAIREFPRSGVGGGVYIVNNICH
jgi:hypothetical protein